MTNWSKARQTRNGRQVTILAEANGHLFGTSTIVNGDVRCHIWSARNGADIHEHVHIENDLLAPVAPEEIMWNNLSQSDKVQLLGTLKLLGKVSTVKLFRGMVNKVKPQGAATSLDDVFDTVAWEKNPMKDFVTLTSQKLFIEWVQENK